MTSLQIEALRVAGGLLGSLRLTSDRGLAWAQLRAHALGELARQAPPRGFGTEALALLLADARAEVDRLEAIASAEARAQAERDTAAAIVARYQAEADGGLSDYGPAEFAAEVAARFGRG